ncbi:DmsC/YnfH family molybdoenzyme membrane anchor subunit [Magnetospirillum sp. UT-4]|uniref:dimethyl sulfoxide reductase anchor subunit family protein n=1 Tax=Magnetospirillum sp. UT-4 TaxID=2681467 RepID=UPI00137DFA1E|nr:DmsC/YnfH family molybdoenzyme membrane anchor subunit [Magnetospirillum sp. UT-4]CAA7614363.1 DMSO reductase chain C [Magnetospirillum sp. UT-4]
MHPAFSIIFFTTAAGAGYGLLLLLALLGPAGLLPDSRAFAVVSTGLALGLVAVGLLSSVIHLGHPERAWRAVSQWKSSWLAREGVAALVTFLPAAIFAVSWALLGRTGAVAGASGIATAIGAVVTVACTAMIYASLKPIHQWHNSWVLPNYLLLSAMTGAVLLNALLHLWRAGRPEFDALVLVLIALSGLAKEGYWTFIGTIPAASTPETATGLGRWGRVRFLESPHSEPNYLLKEMGFAIGRKHSVRLRLIARTLGFTLPLLATVLALGLPAAALPASLLAALAVALGIIIERWLFFAEARHTVTLYYGATTV